MFSAPSALDFSVATAALLTASAEVARVVSAVRPDAFATSAAVARTTSLSNATVKLELIPLIDAVKLVSRSDRVELIAASAALASDTSVAKLVELTPIAVVKEASAEFKLDWTSASAARAVVASDAIELLRDELIESAEA